MKRKLTSSDDRSAAPLFYFSRCIGFVFVKTLFAVTGFYNLVAKPDGLF